MPMKFWPNRRLTKTLGLLTSALVLACASPPTTPAAIAGEPFSKNVERLDEYDQLRKANEAPKIRAWIREADRTIRANNEIADVKPSDIEDQPWLTRLWKKFSGLFKKS